MGSKSSKNKKADTSLEVGKEFYCPYCHILFNKKTKFFQVKNFQKFQKQKKKKTKINKI